MVTREDMNFITVRHVLDKPCTDLLQEVLRHHVPETDLHKLLNDPAIKRTIIPFVRKLNQETKLYPQTGVFNGSYAGFDLSLLYVLIRNLTSIPSHNTGWGNAPDKKDNSIAANIERIRLLRNEYAHGSTSHLTDKELKKERKNIISCIHGIEKTLHIKSTQFEDAAEEIFEGANKQHDLGEDIAKCRDEIRTVQKRQAEHEMHFQKKTEEIQGDILTVDEILTELEKPLQKKAKELQETEYEKSIFRQWQEDDDFFISTKAFESVSKMIKTNNLVIVMGHSGSGKSAIIQHIALQYRKRGWIVKPVYSFKEIHDAYKSENLEKHSYIFVFNDPIGKESYDEMAFNEWVRYREIIDLLIKRAKLLLTCRRSIVSDTRATGFFEQKLGDFGIDEQRLVKVDVNDNHCKLSKDEKKNMFKKHLPDVKPTKEDFDQICEIDMYFPLLCKLSRAKLLQKRNIVDVFKEPGKVLEKEIKTYKAKDKEMYCGLVCLILSKNNLCMSGLNKNTALFSKTLKMCELQPNTSPSTITNKLKPLCGFLVKRIGGKYSFYHDFVMEVTTYVCGSEHPEETLDFADVSFLRKRVREEKNKSSNPFTIVLEHQHIGILVNRLIKELTGDRFIEVILSPCMRNDLVISRFKEQLNDSKMLKLITKPKDTTGKNQDLQHYMNESWYTRFEFINSEVECSPLFAMISFCHDELSKHCLNLLKTKENVLWKKLSALFLNLTRKEDNDLEQKGIFPAICANGNKDFLQIYTDDEIVEYKNMIWNNMYPIHIMSVFHNYHILDIVINEDTNVDIFTTGTKSMTALMLASGNNTHERVCCMREETESTESNLRNRTVEHLLYRGANINLCNEKGMSSLWIAFQNGHESTAKLLLVNGADVNLCNNDGISPLWVACYNGHESTAMLLLVNGADINLCNKNETSPLWIACYGGYERTANVLLVKGADMNLCNKDGVSPLLVACQNGHESTAKLLLVNGADMNLCNKNGTSPLWIACQNGHESTSQLLLVNGVDINLCNKNRVSPLLIACGKGNENTAKLLLANGADVNLCNVKGTSPLWIACNNEHKNIAKLLLVNGADVNLCNEEETSPLLIACYNGYKSTAKDLLDNDAEMNLCNKDEWTPLLVACQNGHKSTARLLLVNGADMNLCNKNGDSPLWVASCNGHESTAKLLLVNGADINLCNKNGDSPLWRACGNGHESTVQFLIVNGSDVNLCNRNGDSPLWVACYNGHEHTAKLLLVYGADVNLCNKNGTSPLWVACQNGHENIVKLLLANDADINLCNEEGRSPLWIACYNGYERTAKVLLVNGADVNLCNKSGTSALWITCYSGHESTAQLLLVNGADINLRNDEGNSPLWIACYNGYRITAKVLLVNEANVDLCNKNGTSPLWVACCNGHECIAKLLMVNGADMNLCNKNGTSPLWIACQNGHELIARVLLGNCVDVNLCNKNGTSPLLIACCNGHESTAKLLLANGADINLCNRDGTRPLSVTSYNGLERTTQLLQSNGAFI